VWLRRLIFDRQDPATLIEMNTEVESQEVSDKNVKADDDEEKGKQDAIKNKVAMAPVTTTANPKILSEHSNNTATCIGRRSKFEARFHELQYAVIESSVLDALRHEELFLLRDVPAVALEGECDEIYLVGAGMGGGFINTQELHIIKYKEVMAGADTDKWHEAVMEEQANLDKHNVFEVVPMDKVPADAIILSSMRAMKKKSNGRCKARLNARGFQQIDDEHDKAASVVNDVTIGIVLVLIIMAGWWAEVMDVRGAFLPGMFQPHHLMYMTVPQGFENMYPPNGVLLLLWMLYGTKQAALQFWKVLVVAFCNMKYDRSKADACMYFCWTAHGLVLWLSWVDDCLVTGPTPTVMEAKASTRAEFDCDEVGELNECVGCKIDWDRKEGSMKITQPVILQSHKDKLNLPTHKPKIGQGHANRPMGGTRKRTSIVCTSACERVRTF
jgi:hypothetical protein